MIIIFVAAKIGSTGACYCGLVSLRLVVVVMVVAL